MHFELNAVHHNDVFLHISNYSLVVSLVKTISVICAYLVKFEAAPTIDAWSLCIIEWLQIQLTTGGDLSAKTFTQSYTEHNKVAGNMNLHILL